MKKDDEFDLHVWVKADEQDIVRTFTMSIGKRGVCIDSPLEQALEAIREVLEHGR